MEMGGFKGGVGVNNDDIAIEFGVEVAPYDTFMLLSKTGAADVFVTLNGTDWTTAPISLADLGAVIGDPVIVTAAGRLYGFRGKFKGLRVMQNGAAALDVTLSYGTFAS